MEQGLRNDLKKEEADTTSGNGGVTRVASSKVQFGAYVVLTEEELVEVLTAVSSWPRKKKQQNEG